MKSRLLSINPLVAIFDEVFDAEIARAVIDAGKDNLVQPTYGTSQGRVVGEKRTNLVARIDQWAHPQITDLVTRISSIVRMPPEHAETGKLLRYEGDQLFDVHFDGYDEVGPHADLYSHGGQRIFTSLSYLNDVPEEGQTAFPNLKIAVRPKLGRVLLFQNSSLASPKVHPDSAHVGFGPGTGVKWVLSVWWRQHHYHIPREFPPAEGDFVEY